MKKKLALLVCVAMSLTMLSGCGGQGAQKGADDAVDQAVTGSSDAGQTVKEESPQHIVLILIRGHGCFGNG